MSRACHRGRRGSNLRELHSASSSVSSLKGFASSDPLLSGAGCSPCSRAWLRSQGGNRAEDGSRAAGAF